jgi:hypothetical protein
MTSPIPGAAIGATSPTSRATFRLVARGAGATNRDADTLRRALLTQWSEHEGTYGLERRLRSLDGEDPSGVQGVDARLAVWFSFDDRSEPAVVPDDPLLAGLSDEFRTQLVDIMRPEPD